MATEKRKPTSKDWEKMQTLFLKGEKPRFIVEKFPELDITAKQVSTKFCKKNLGEKKKKIEEKVQEKQEQRIIDEKDEENKRCLKLYDKGLDVVEHIMAVYLETAEQRKKRGNVDPFKLEKIFQCIAHAQKGKKLSFEIDNKDEGIKEPEILYVENLNQDKI